MAKNNTRTLMRFAALAMVLAALVLVDEATSMSLCGTDTNSLEKCRPAVTGNNPPPPGNECCTVVHATNLQCICRFKYYLPMLRIDPSKVSDLLRKCGVTTIPPSCKL